MIINHNLGSMNALAALNTNSMGLQKALQELSTGKKINSAADNASGYAISQKMQGQINGLDQASQNAQDGISMIQTASGALNETTSILQNMRQLAVQASNSTTTSADRADLQIQFNQMASQINNIGNTTQFNTQNLLQGSGLSNLSGTGFVVGASFSGGAAAYTTQATQTTTISTAAAAADTMTFSVNGQSLAVTFAAAGANSQTNDVGYNVSGNAATVNIDATPTTLTTAAGLRDALTQMINQNSTLKGNYTVSGTGSAVTITAVQGGQFDGAAGSIAAVSQTGTVAETGGTASTGTNVAAAQATDTSSLLFAGIASAADVSSLVGKGFTINGQQVQFYNADNGPYTGSAIGVNLSDAAKATSGWNAAVANAIVSQVGTKISGVTLSASGTAGDVVATATQGGLAGNSLAIADGGTQKDFNASFQIGANTGQTMSVNVGDMRAAALSITGKAGQAGYSAVANVNNGTNNTNVEAALDISTTSNADSAINVIDNAVQTVTTEQANLGAVQNRLQSSINNLGTSSQNLTTAVSGITDVNMAAEMATFTKDNVLQQAAVSMLAQANQQPQLVLKLLG